jgi:hypothetical protein
MKPVGSPFGDGRDVGKLVSLAAPEPQRYRGRVAVRPERPMGRRDVNLLVAAFWRPRATQDDPRLRF